jgi:hypothetical protein
MSRYFYKGVGIENLVSDGNNGTRQASQINQAYGYSNIPVAYTDSKAFSQVQTLGFRDTGGDIGRYYTAFYQTRGSTERIDLINQISKTTYNEFSAVIVGGSGGGGGGGGNGFHNRNPTQGSYTLYGYAGAGGGGGGMSIVNRTSIGVYNQLYIFVGGGGGGAGAGASSPNDAGQVGSTGGAGQQSFITLEQNNIQGLVLGNANGGAGGGGGYPGNANSNANSAQPPGGGGQGNVVDGTSGNAPNAPTTAGSGGDVGISSVYPNISGGAGGSGGQYTLGGNTGSNGSVRIYFFRS